MYTGQHLSATPWLPSPTPPCPRLPLVPWSPTLMDSLPRSSPLRLCFGRPSPRGPVPTACSVWWSPLYPEMGRMTILIFQRN